MREYSQNKMLAEFNQKPDLTSKMTGFPNPLPYVMPHAPGAHPATSDKYKVAQQAQMVSQNFGVPMQGSNPGMWANILPAAIQIKEHEKMNEVAMKYQEKYIKDFQTKYGFSEPQLGELRNEFEQITKHITELIPDGELRTMYKKYVESYPNMFLSMIPREALQAKLAVKCWEDNRVLRNEVAEMSKCVTTLVKSLSKLQMASGVPPIVSLMFESMPDPLTAITDPMYSSYNNAINTYHQLTGSTTLTGSSITMPNPSGSGVIAAAEGLLSSPVAALEAFTNVGGPIHVADDASGPVNVTQDEIKALTEVIKNMGTSSGCQTFGNEWNHTGPEPAMNPAMCLGEKDVMQPGNPRNAQGRTAVYKAQRTQDGGAQWVMKGQVPNVATQGVPSVLNHAQITHSARYQQPPQGVWGQYGVQPAPTQERRKKAKGKGKGKSKGRRA
jgi:hypothetical protein